MQDGQGGGSPGLLSPAKGWAGTFPNPLCSLCRLQPHKWCRNARQSQKSCRGVPTSPGRGGGSKSTHHQLAERFGGTQPRWGGRLPTRMPRDHQPVLWKHVWLLTSSSLFLLILAQVGGAAGGPGAPTQVPPPRCCPQQVRVKAEPGSSSVLGGCTSVWLPVRAEPPHLPLGTRFHFHSPRL